MRNVIYPKGFAIAFWPIPVLDQIIQSKKNVGKLD